MEGRDAASAITPKEDINGYGAGGPLLIQGGHWAIRRLLRHSSKFFTAEAYAKLCAAMKSSRRKRPSLKALSFDRHPI